MHSPAAASSVEGVRQLPEGAAQIPVPQLYVVLYNQPPVFLADAEGVSCNLSVSLTSVFARDLKFAVTQPRFIPCNSSQSDGLLYAYKVA